MKKKKFLRDAIKTKEQYGLSDEQMDEYFVPEVERREKEYKTKVARKYGKELYTEATKWWLSLNPREKKITGAESTEEIIHAYMSANPDKLSTSDLRKALGKDKVKPLVNDSTYDPIGPPEYGEDGRIRPGKKIVEKRKPPRQPSPQELSKMSVKEIASLIEQVRDYYWPKGGGDSEIPGIDSVGVEKE